jgi:hypothetical protein
MILSVDLASRRWDDNGIAVMCADGPSVSVRFVRPTHLGLDGTPEPERFADALDHLARAEGARVILLDGPQGWRAESSPLVHLRECERATRAPGKTGLPGIVKPATWTRMAEFCVALFDALDARGWPRFGQPWAGTRVAIESFPTHAWRMLGVSPLPAKSKVRDLTQWRQALTAHGVTLTEECSHDELQAVVAGLAGIALLKMGTSGCDIRGEPPILEGGVWREGFIVSPMAEPRAHHSEPVATRPRQPSPKTRAPTHDAPESPQPAGRRDAARPPAR